MSVDIGAEFFLDLGHKVNETHRQVMKGDPKPILKPVGGSFIVPTGFSGPQLLILEGFPAKGRCWNILKVGVFGADTHTAIANVTADVFAGDVLEFGGAPFQDCILSAATVPSVTQFSTEVEWCYSGQQVYAYFNGTGVAAGQSYVVVARVAEFNVFDVEARQIP